MRFIKNCGLHAFIYLVDFLFITWSTPSLTQSHMSPIAWTSSNTQGTPQWRQLQSLPRQPQSPQWPTKETALALKKGNGEEENHCANCAFYLDKDAFHLDKELVQTSLSSRIEGDLHEARLALGPWNECKFEVIANIMINKHTYTHKEKSKDCVQHCSILNNTHILTNSHLV